MLPFPGIESASSTFVPALEALARRLGLDADAIAGVMAIETGGTFSPSIQNPSTGATGLIQFMPSTAKLLGTTTDALRQMTDTEQLEYVERFFSPIAHAVRSQGDHYLAVFAPAFLGRPDSAVIARKGAPAYDLNRGLDVNKDGSITAGDIRQKLENRLRRTEGLPPLPPSAPASPPSAVPLIGWTVSLGVTAVIFHRIVRREKT